MKNLRLIPLILIALAVLPTALLFWKSTATLNNHIRSTIVNDPSAELSQDLKVMKGAFQQWGDKINSTASRFSENDNYKKFLSSPVPSLPAFLIFGKKLSDSTQLPLIILTDKKGDILYDNLNIPKPIPTAEPTTLPIKKILKSKSDAPLLASAKDIPGMDRALSGITLNGFFVFQGLLYNGTLVPVLGKDKILGIIILGDQLNNAFVQSLKSTAGNDLTIYSKAQTWSSSPAPLIGLNIEEAMASTQPNSPYCAPATINSIPLKYLTGGFQLLGLDGNPIAVLEAARPYKQAVTLEGSPQAMIVRQGWWILLAGLFFAAGATLFLTAPLRQISSAVDQLKNGDFNVDLPLHRPDEWGLLARSLQDMIIGLKEKDRVSLILGKVVSPLMAKTLLEAKDLFALKGERREVTILHADLRGFNTLGENMAPQNLVEALNQYFTLINEIVFKHEGMLDKFIGESAVAIWGAPFSHENKEIRAVQTALEIQEALKEFNIARIKKGLPPFTVGIGIHTGLVVSGNLGSDKRCDYTVIGDPLHVAARLCSLAPPGKIVVSEETYLKTKSLVEGKSLNPIAVKDSNNPLSLYEINEIA